MSDISGPCFQCQKTLELMKGFSRREECPSCGADVHACLNCKFYDQGSYNECREPSADVVKEKDRANHCDYFQFAGGNKQGADKDALKSAADALFKK